MKIFDLFIAIAFLFLNTSCEKETIINMGFDDSISKNSRGLVIADFTHFDDNIYLTGVISLSDGEVEVTLTAPGDEVLYSELLVAPGQLNINEVFDASPGYWKLKYKSIEGTGSIDLHMQNY